MLAGVRSRFVLFFLLPFSVAVVLPVKAFALCNHQTGVGGPDLARQFGRNLIALALAAALSSSSCDLSGRKTQHQENSGEEWALRRLDP